MLDRERILAKIDELEGYLHDLRTIAPESFTVYQQIEKRRACERLLQIAVECVIDICGLIVSGLRLGLPAEEDDIIEKLAQAHILSPQMQQTVRKMGNFHEPRKVVNSLSGSIADMARRRRSSAVRQSCLQHEPIRVKMQ